jgi:DNA primase
MTAEAYCASRGLPKETAPFFKLHMGEGGILIPVYDPWGNRVAKILRAIDNPSLPRYNVVVGSSPNRYPYGLHLCKRFAHERGYVVVTEGPFDVMAVQMAGIPCVGMLGSQLTDSQAYLLTRYAHTVLIALDRDTEGTAKVSRVAEKVARLGVVPLVLSLPSKLDDLGEAWEKLKNPKAELKEWIANAIRD